MARPLVLNRATSPVSRSGAGTSRRSTLSVLAAALHPEPWTKNILVFAGLMLVGGRLLDPAATLAVISTFVHFCALSCAIYLFNELRDRDSEAGRQPDNRVPFGWAAPCLYGRVARYSPSAHVLTNDKIGSARHRRPADRGCPVVVWGDRVLRKERLRPIESLLLRSPLMARALRRTTGHLRVWSRVQTERGQLFGRH